MDRKIAALRNIVARSRHQRVGVKHRFLVFDEVLAAGRSPMPSNLTSSGVSIVSGRARALRSFTVFLKRDRTARGLSFL
ncbi:hypothetical protein Enr13x_06490 [Stieleria neptunia]|uniref:Uncharacterized protein n=1 Tax=Stieleria neptunia TaxID=2527979 RepID=A0A518HJ24_9BACT|nr:hypothetical protein Enr13x_06490 [Stieleria neptunia]